ncbi:MAG: hypothetical protein U0324_05480 [Polyangiales bacterium]
MPRPAHAAALAALLAAVVFYAGGLAATVVPRLCAGLAFTPALVALASGVAWMASTRGRPARGVVPLWTLPVACALMAVPVFAAWGEARTHGTFIGGLLPYSDAGDYVLGALGLLDDGRLDVWNSRRPLNGVLLAVRLALAGGDLRGALALQVALLGSALWLAARAVARDLGLASGLAWFGAASLFGAVFVPATLSESLGVTVGSLALALLWRAATSRAPWHLAAGFAALSVALNARSGPFLVLPALLLWAARLRDDPARRWSPRSLGAALAGVAAGFAFNGLVFRLHHGIRGAAQANFSYTLYGLARGGLGWEQVFVDHPELRAMAEGPRAEAVYRHAFAVLRAHPWGLVVGLFRNVEQLVRAWTTSATGGLAAGHPVLQWALALAAVAGVAAVLRGAAKRSPGAAHTGLVALGAAGAFASAPVIYMDGDERVFAAAVPLVMAGAVYVAAALTQQRASEGEPRDDARAPAALLGALALCWVAGVPVARMVRGRTTPAASVTCAEGASAIDVAASPARLTLVDDPTATTSPRLDVRRFRARIGPRVYMGASGLAPVLSALPAGTTLSLVFDRRAHELQYLAAPSAATLGPRCVRRTTADARTVLAAE